MGGGDLYDQSNEHENLHFNNEYDTHMNFEHYEESGLELDLVTILDHLHVPNPRRSGLVEESNRVKTHQLLH